MPKFASIYYPPPTKINTPLPHNNAGTHHGLLRYRPLPNLRLRIRTHPRALDLPHRLGVVHPLNVPVHAGLVLEPVRAETARALGVALLVRGGDDGRGLLVLVADKRVQDGLGGVGDDEVRTRVVPHKRSVKRSPTHQPKNIRTSTHTRTKK
jgi:hypothetical protein